MGWRFAAKCSNCGRGKNHCNAMVLQVPKDLQHICMGDPVKKFPSGVRAFMQGKGEQPMTTATEDTSRDLGYIVCLPPLTRDDNGLVSWPDWTGALVDAMHDHGASPVTIVDFLLWEAGVIIEDLVKPGVCNAAAKAKLLGLITAFSGICSGLVEPPVQRCRLDRH